MQYGDLCAQPFLPPPGPENNARFVADVTVPDGTVFQPGETFTKTWRVLNSGSVAWEKYQLFFSRGDQLEGPAFVEISATPAGREVEISVPMKAPGLPGVYQGHWGFRTAEGRPFGGSIFVLIMVQGRLPDDVQGRLGNRPVLYLDVDGEEPVISAVSADGTLRKGLVRTIGTGCLTCVGSSSAVWSPDGRSFAFVALDYNGTDSVLYRQELEGAAKEIIRMPSGLEDPIWSPDGKKIALLGEGRIHVVDLASRSNRTYSLEAFRETRGRPGSRFTLNQFRWSPAGRHLLFSWGAALVLDTESGRIDVISRHPVFSEWASDGNGVYYIDLLFQNNDVEEFENWGGFYYRPLGQAKPVELMDGPGLMASLGVTKRDLASAALWPGFFTVSPDGTALAFLVRRNKVSDLYLYRTRKKVGIDFSRPERTIRINDLPINLEWSPAGKGMAGIGEAGAGLGIKFLDFESGSWTTLAVIPPHETVSAIYGLAGRKGISWAE
ncbi:MAG: NBR1-Ig-like domain-containing protein [Nitrospirota bacterium]